MNIDADRIDTVIERVQERTRRFEEEIAKVVKPYGMKRLPDKLFLDWFSLNAFVKYPPQPMVTPSGQAAVVSPWVAMLPYVNGGEDVLKRVAKLRAAQMQPQQAAPAPMPMPRQMAPMPMQAPPMLGLGRVA